MSADITFQVRKTHELTSVEVAALTQLFEEVFHKQCPDDLFYRKFAGSCLGYSLHSLLYLGNQLIGAFSAIPVRYLFFGQPRLFAITADLMILPAHRGAIGRVKRLADGLYSALTFEGVAFVFCCLRNEIFKLHRAISDWREVGSVHYYAAPMGPLRFLARAWNALIRGGPQSAPFAVEKINDRQFAEYRYSVFPTEYKALDLAGGASAVYATDLYYPIEGIPPRVRLALLLDVYPLTQANFDHAVAAVRKREPKSDALAYQGYLPFQPRDMIRIPARYEKQAWTLAGRILNADLVDERIFSIENWNINLSNGDLV